MARLATSGDYDPTQLARLAEAIFKGLLAAARLSDTAAKETGMDAIANALADLAALRTS